MRLGLNLGYWGTEGHADNLAVAVEADKLGYSVVWAAEAYGSDAVTVLTWVAAHTQRIDIGSGVLQIPARAPAATAMAAATLDALSGGRFRLGLGVSGPQVSEGWYGVPFAKPLARTREYVDVVRKVLAREKLEYAGQHITLPLPDGPGKALRLTVHPIRDNLPLYLAAIGPKNLELTGELADGWLGIFVAPEFTSEILTHLGAGRAKAGKDLSDFDVVATVPVVIGDDLEACAEPVSWYSALYVGGMGSREQNFYNALAARMGYAKEAATVQDLYLAKRHRDAAAALPFEFLDRTALLGPRERITERLRAYAEAGVTTLAITPFAGDLDARLATVRTMAEALDASGVGE